MRAQEASVGEVEGVLLVARGVVGGGVERVEAVPFVVDVRAVGEREAHAAEDLHGAVEQLRDRVQAARRDGARAGQAQVEAGKGVGFVLGGEESGAFLQGSGEGGADFVEAFADGGAFFLADGFHALADLRERALAAEVFDARLFQRERVGGGGDVGLGLGEEGFEFLDHGFRRWWAAAGIVRRSPAPPMPALWIAPLGAGGVGGTTTPSRKASKVATTPNPHSNNQTTPLPILASGAGLAQSCQWNKSKLSNTSNAAKRLPRVTLRRVKKAGSAMHR